MYSSLLIKLALPFVCFVPVFLLPVYRTLAVPSDVEIVETNDPVSTEPMASNAIDLDGILFETWAPETEWVVPLNEPEAYTSVSFGFRITNNSEEPVRLRPYGRLDIGLNGPDSSWHAYVIADSITAARETDYLLIQPGERVPYLIECKLFWTEDGELVARGIDTYGNNWLLFRLQPNMTYQLWMIYMGDPPVSIDLERLFVERWRYPPDPAQRILSSARVRREDAPYTFSDTNIDPADMIVIEGILGNRVHTPAVEIFLVQP